MVSRLRRFWSRKHPHKMLSIGAVSYSEIDGVTLRTLLRKKQDVVFVSYAELTSSYKANDHTPQRFPVRRSD